MIKNIATGWLRHAMRSVGLSRLVADVGNLISHSPWLEHLVVVVYNCIWWRPRRIGDELSPAPHSLRPRIFLTMMASRVDTAILANHGGHTNTVVLHGHSISVIALL